MTKYTLNTFLSAAPASVIHPSELRLIQMWRQCLAVLFEPVNAVFVCTAAACVWSAVCYVKYRWRRDEAETRQMYDMVERIIGKDRTVFTWMSDRKCVCLWVWYLLLIQMWWRLMVRLAKRTRTYSPTCPSHMSETRWFSRRTGKSHL